MNTPVQYPSSVENHTLMLHCLKNWAQPLSEINSPITAGSIAGLPEGFKSKLRSSAFFRLTYPRSDHG